MKRVVIIHCWEGTPDYCWYPQTKKELEEKGFEVQVPEMPETMSPKLATWLPKLKEVAGVPNENLFLIGHSLGCITILKYLETLDENQKVGGVVMIAGFTDDVGYSELTNFFVDEIDFEKIKTKANHFIAIQSDNDPYVDLKYGDILKEKLGVKLIIKHAMDHFSTITSFPDVSEEVLMMT